MMKIGKPTEKAQIEFEIFLIGKFIKAREEKGLSQRHLVEISGVKQSAIACPFKKYEINAANRYSFKIPSPLGYTLKIASAKD